jgi:hypothetical protein
VKIAIVGNGKTRDLAPFDDDEWEIWTTGSVTKAIPRYDVVYEIHKGADLSNFGGAAVVGCPGSGALTEIEPRDLELQYGRIFTGSIAYMLAGAIDADPDEIGLWGIDMSSDTEYGSKREAVIFFVGFARGLGIPITVSAGSDLMPPRRFYAIDDPSEEETALDAQIRELSGKLADSETKRIKSREQEMWLHGAVSALKYRYKIVTGGDHGA